MLTGILFEVYRREIISTWAALHYAEWLRRAATRPSISSLTRENREQRLKRMRKDSNQLDGKGQDRR